MATELVIFDCDGVLVDSEVLAIEIEAQLLTEAGFALTADEIADRFVGLSYATMMNQLAADFGRPVPEKLNAAMQQMTLDRFPGELQAVPGIDTLLASLELPRCVASSSDMDRIELSLGITKLQRHFDPQHVFSAQMVEHGKPAPDLFLHAAHTMGFGPYRCLVVEDSPHGVTAAVAAGMRVVGFAGGGHVRPALIDRLHAAGALAVVEKAADLSAFL